MTDAHTLDCPGDEGCTCGPVALPQPGRAALVAQRSAHNWLAHCPNGHVVRGTAEQFNAGHGWLRCGCGLTAPARPMDVQHVAGVACGPRCWGAKGIACHCACAGTNHGAGLTYKETK